MLASRDAYYPNSCTNLVPVVWRHQERIEALICKGNAFLVENPRVKRKMDRRQMTDPYGATCAFVKQHMLTLELRSLALPLTAGRDDSEHPVRAGLPESKLVRSNGQRRRPCSHRGQSLLPPMGRAGQANTGQKARSPRSIGIDANRSR
jgi:hypothetical protein